ncbi:MAG: hypothetical protein V4659_11330 [Pseudomonadota bacterium]
MKKWPEDWDAIVAYGLTLPAAELGTAYGKPALKLNGKMLAATTGPTPDSFVAYTALGDKDVLLETDPVTFWETDHYRGWPAVLVRYGGSDAERVKLVLQRAWWERAKPAQRAKFGSRP